MRKQLENFPLVLFAVAPLLLIAAFAWQLANSLAVAAELSVFTTFAPVLLFMASLSALASALKMARRQ